MSDDFKNFHRLLCERFGYVHDEKDWQRDQLSLIEWISMRGPREQLRSLRMNDTEFRAVLDWRMTSDPWCDDVPREVIDDWIERECQMRGYASFAVAYHEHHSLTADDGQFGVGA